MLTIPRTSQGAGFGIGRGEGAVRALLKIRWGGPDLPGLGAWVPLLGVIVPVVHRERS